MPIIMQCVHVTPSRTEALAWCCIQAGNALYNNTAPSCHQPAAATVVAGALVTDDFVLEPFPGRRKYSGRPPFRPWPPKLPLSLTTL